MTTTTHARRITAADTFVARHDIGVRLRTIRLRANLTGTALAERLGCHMAKISRIENATRSPSVGDVRAWCVACNAEDQIEDLVAATVAADQAYAEWRNEQRGGLLRLQTRSDDLLAKISRARIYESRVVPSLLQTEAYAAEILGRLQARRSSPDDAREAAAYRFGLRRFLTTERTFAYLIEESVLQAPIADGDVMRAQLEQLIADTQLPQVSVGIIPLGVHREQWPTESFYLYDDDHLRVPLVSGRWTAKVPGDITEYVNVFRGLSAAAVFGDKARELITRAMP
jgi:transcriptional regulator with XRE-family HTH domain